MCCSRLGEEEEEEWTGEVSWDRLLNTRECNRGWKDLVDSVGCLLVYENML